MVIRDDRKAPMRARLSLDPTPENVAANPAHFAPDRVLYDCPDCGRSHFVTVDACPDAATAAAETAMVDVRRAA